MRSVRPEVFAEARDGLLGGGLGVGQRKDFGRHVAFVADLAERVGDGTVVRMAETHRLTIAVGEMNVAEVAPGESQRVGHACFLDVRVEEINEEFHVLGPERLEQFESVGDRFDQVSLVAIERFEEQGNAKRMSAWAKLFEGFPQPVERLLADDGPFAATLHGADDGGRAKSTGKINNAGDEVAGLPANLSIRIGQAQFVDDPAGAGTHGGKLEFVLFEQLLELLRIQVFGGAGKNFHGIEPVSGSAGATGGKVIPKDKRTTPRFGHEGNRHSTVNHGDEELGKCGWEKR